MVHTPLIENEKVSFCFSKSFAQCFCFHEKHCFRWNNTHWISLAPQVFVRWAKEHIGGSFSCRQHIFPCKLFVFHHENGPSIRPGRTIYSYFIMNTGGSQNNPFSLSLLSLQEMEKVQRWRLLMVSTESWVNPIKYARRVVVVLGTSYCSCCVWWT